MADKGRLGIYEVLGNSPEVQRLMLVMPLAKLFRTKAIKEGMIVMQLDGLLRPYAAKQV